MIKNQTMTCVTTPGGGEERSEGNWRIKTHTEKTLVVEKISDGDYENYKKGERIICRRGNRNPLRDWGDGTFTIYPKQAGTPYFFTKTEAQK